MKRLSVKMKVTLWFTLLMTLLGCVMLGLLFYVGEQSAQVGTRNTMIAMVENSWDEMDGDGGQLEIDDDLEYFKDGAYLAVYDGAGLPLYGAAPREFDNSLPFSDRELRTVQSGGRTWYLYDAREEVKDCGTVWVRGVAAADNVDSTIVTLLRLAAVLLPLFVTLAAVGGYLIARRAFRPVRHITQTARQISEGNDLSRRIGLGEGRDEIYTLAAEFDRMFTRLEEAFENEKQFTSDASHELRTPISVILSQCEYGLEHAATLEEAKECLEAVMDQAEKMAALIAQLLTLARADKNHKKLHLEPVDLSELAQMVALQQEESAAQRGIQLETQIEPGILVQGDETMLMRMLINLMENGIKYGKGGGRLTMRLARRDGQAVGEVEDDGIGIAADQLDQVWKRFWQADPARGGGAGLGLSMVKWIAEAHGGSVAVESRLGEGTVFRFFLPIKTKKTEE